MKFINIHKSLVAIRSICMLILLLATLSGCKKWYDLPADLDYFSDRVDYTQQNFSPVLGRTTLFTNILNYDNSSLPLKFEMLNVRNMDGTAADNLTNGQPVLVWTGAYDGLEKSMEEIQAKRKLENHPLWELRKSGELMLWRSATNNLIPNYQGSGLLNPGGYLFDIKVSNSGGEKTIKNLVLNPLRESPYDPTNRDAVTGLQKDSILPTELSGMVGQNNRILLSNTNKDVYIYFKRKGDGHSLTFKFIDKNNAPINTNAFNKTKWSELIHGFNMVQTPDFVRYDVAYPIPLVKIPTKYTTSDGSKAAVAFVYDRLGFDGIRETGRLAFNFSIFREGDWEIIFHFRNESPRFQDEY
ncbi:MAG TPA: DUF5007 domain-containing protein [Pedobacter sp.]|uniref:DUF5007 domain-containing protein n=1 Tax=Pedobacter sp. TaxID=1411316 RepID=UPI002B6D40D8|nr:DUF5007 domain-containing protein [Pedobacter sp.]HMI02811.1 DUF5007 domain-containing protein [Pedobacter sp.]